MKTLILAGAVCAAYATGAVALYEIDPSWKPAFPALAGTFSAVAVSGDLVYISQRNASYPDPILVLSKEGKLLGGFGKEHIAVANGTFGGHGLSVQPADEVAGRAYDTLWVMDFTNHTVMSFNPAGDLLGKAGRSGVASPDANKFGSVADATFRRGSAFFADGDGGDDNRVERWVAIKGWPEKVEWVSPSAPPSKRRQEVFDNPHSICWHQASDRLIVADREHNRIAILDPETGALEGNLTCDALQLGVKGRPFGVRAMERWGKQLLFVAVADNPQDGKNQFVHVVDISTLAKDGSCKAVLQSIVVDPSVCYTPHLMGLDRTTGDVYLACVHAVGSNVVRFIPSSRNSTIII